MSTNTRPRWFIRDVIPGDVLIGDPGAGDGCEFRATVRVTATVINGCGGRSEIRFDAYCGFSNHEDAGNVVAIVVKGGIEGARKAARAFCDAANADHDAPTMLEPGNVIELPPGTEISSPAPNAVAAFIAPGGYLEQAYRAGFEASSEGWNFEIKGRAVFKDEDFQSRMECDLDILRDDIGDSIRT